MRFCVRFSLAVLAYSVAAFGMTSFSHAQTKTGAMSSPAVTRQGYAFVDLANQPSDPAAVSVVTKLFAADIKELTSQGEGAPTVLARFVSLGKGMPKTSIAAQIVHIFSCGVKHCRTIILEGTAANRYRIAWDKVAGPFVLQPNANSNYYDLMLPTPTNVGDGQTIWSMNAAKHSYFFRSGPLAGK